MKFEEEYTSDKRERSQQIAEKYRRNAARRAGNKDVSGSKSASSGGSSGSSGRKTANSASARKTSEGAAARKQAAGGASGGTAAARKASGSKPAGKSRTSQRPSSKPAFRGDPDDYEEDSAPLLPSREMVENLMQDRRVQIGALIVAALLLLFLVSRLFAIGRNNRPAPVETTTEAAAETTTAEETTTTEEETTVETLGSFAESGRPAVALTFDDGPGKESTNTILDVLEQYGAKATFFIQGQSVSSNPDALVRMVELGCELGNHTWDHTKLTTISASERAVEYSKAADAIKQASGGYEPTVFRPPYGSSDKEIRAEIDIPIIIWSLDSLDWKSRNADSVIEEIRSQIKGGDIILLHDIHDSTAEAVKRLVPLLQDDLGYKLLTVTELYEYYGEPLTLHMGHAYAEPQETTAAPTDSGESATEAAAAADSGDAADAAGSGESTVETTSAAAQ